MAFDSTTGMLGGAAIGTAIMPGAGTAVGAGLGGIFGGMYDSYQKGAEAEKNKPGLEDPNQIARLREIDATRKQISEGRDPLTQQRISDIKKMGETTKGQLGKYTGGDVGGTVTAMLRAQRNIGQGINQGYSESQQRIPFYENLSTQMGNRIEQRKLELGIHETDRLRAQQAQADKESNAAASGLIGSIGGGGGMMGGMMGGGQAGSMLGSIGGGGTNSLGQFSSGIQTPGLGQAFNQGLAGTNGVGGFGQQLGGGFGGFGGGNSMIGQSPVGVNDFSNYVNG